MLCAFFVIADIDVDVVVSTAPIWVLAHCSHVYMFILHECSCHTQRGYKLRYDYEWVVTTAPINQYTSSHHLFVIDAATAAIAVAVFDLYYSFDHDKNQREKKKPIKKISTDTYVQSLQKHCRWFNAQARTNNIINANHTIRYDTIGDSIRLYNYCAK